ncbi:MAG: kinase [Rhodocyclaceae bacterium]|jgi:Predicted kinase related to galactokinase and mevalonate kinase|nr:kinase [Rhodocyclaceae bacterium]MCL4757181.1 kinase [Rhodocyclaceae bacterium]
MIITRTPFRISFFGGGTDYPAWSREHGGAVLATTINKYCYISCRHLPPFFEHKHRIVYSLIENVRTIDEIRHPAVRAVLATMGVGSDPDGLEIHHDGDLPARSGLGSSSSFTVGLIHAIRALRGQYVSKDELAREAIHIEQDVIGENVGSQDQVSAAFGGLNRIGFRRDGSFDVAPVIVDPARLTLLQDHLMLCFTGISRIASEVARSKIDNLGNRHAELTRMREMVEAAIAILHDAGEPIERFGSLLDEGWQAKRSLSHQVSTPQIDALYETARAAGALGGKLLGAGGGGFFLLFAPPEAQPRIRERLGKLIHVPFRFEHSGSRVVLYQPNGL